jgi:hypothetical protein
VVPLEPITPPSRMTGEALEDVMISSSPSGWGPWNPAALTEGFSSLHLGVGDASPHHAIERLFGCGGGGVAHSHARSSAEFPDDLAHELAVVAGRQIRGGAC